MTAASSQFAHENLLRELAPQVLGAVTASATSARPKTRFRTRSLRPRVMAKGRPARQPARVADPGCGTADDRSHPQRECSSSRDDRYDGSLARTGRRATSGPAFARRFVSSSVPLRVNQTTRSFFCSACCHPALTASSAIALTLRAVGGLTTAEIASVPGPGVDDGSADQPGETEYQDIGCRSACQRRRSALIAWPRCFTSFI